MGQAFSSDDPHHLGLEWVRARLAHDPRTRLLGVRARASGETLVLEGQVSTLEEKAVAGRVARRAQHQGFFDNRIQVLESDASALGLSGRPTLPSRVQAA